MTGRLSSDMESISRNHPRNLGPLERGRDATCVWDDCKDVPHEELAAPLCLNHAKRLTVQVMLLTSGKINHHTKRLNTQQPPVFEAEKNVREARYGFVYFVRFADRIKIGYSDDPTLRLRNIPHDEILAFVPGTMSTEKKYHNMFKDLRITGEWFASHRRLLDYIGTLPVHEALAA